jgi:pyruvate/2-oxoglutarate dehydrogenase complex dihydrolipoamide acyltransferase (E2) component
VQQGQGRTDLALLHALIRDFAASLLQQGQDAELKEILARHQDTNDADAGDKDAPDPATQAAAAPVEPATSDTESPDDWMQQWQQMEAAQADAARQRERQRAQRKAASRRARQQAQPQQADASQSIRDVYRKLASALHPDREQDLAERARKTALMQRVNQAYATKNLLDLLQLQLEIEQIDVKSIQTMGEDRLRRYNEVLAEQLADLQKETAGVERALKTQVGLGHGAELTSIRMTRALKEQARGLQQDIAYYRIELKELEDPRTLKRWLREQRG